MSELTIGWKYAAERDSTLPPLQAAFMRHFQSSADTHLVFGEITKRLSAAAVRAKDRRRARKRARLREASAPPGAVGGAPAPPPSFEDALASRGLRLAGIMLRFSKVRGVWRHSLSLRGATEPHRGGTVSGAHMIALLLTTAPAVAVRGPVHGDAGVLGGAARRGEVDRRHSGDGDAAACAREVRGHGAASAAEHDVSARCGTCTVTAHAFGWSRTMERGGVPDGATCRCRRLEMLIEVVQGPMRANQRTVASAKGIDAAARIVMWTNPEIEARGIDKVGLLHWVLWFDRARTRVTDSYCVVYGVVLRQSVGRHRVSGTD